MIVISFFYVSCNQANNKRSDCENYVYEHNDDTWCINSKELVRELSRKGCSMIKSCFDTVSSKTTAVSDQETVFGTEVDTARDDGGSPYGNFSSLTMFNSTVNDLFKAVTANMTIVDPQSSGFSDPLGCPKEHNANGWSVAELVVVGGAVVGVGVGLLYYYLWDHGKYFVVPPKDPEAADQDLADNKNDSDFSDYTQNGADVEAHPLAVCDSGYQLSGNIDDCNKDHNEY